MSAAKYDTSTGIEGEYEPDSKRQVLKNLLGIQTKEAIDEAEIFSLVDAQERYLEIIETDTQFAAALIRQMHKDWLGDIYPWAGQYRTVEMSKDGFTWPPAHRVEDNMARFEETFLVKHTPFNFDAPEKAYEKLAAIHAEFLLIHPFREGNGRLARWLADLMCLQAGLPQPDYGFTDSDGKHQKDLYLAAVIQGYECNYTPLAAFFREALERATNA